MLRFLSRRRGRGTAAANGTSDATNSQQSAATQIKPQRIPTNKNLIQCKVILLDGTDLTVDLSVSCEMLKTFSI